MSMRDIINTTAPLFENNVEHRKALASSGFWGKAGAGCVFVAKDTGRILLAHRSKHVQEPGTWGTYGGAIDNDESPVEAACREVYEETRYDGPMDIKPLYVFRKDSFAYHNFLIVVPKEFTPTLDKENQGYKWCDYGDWPSPLHFGLKALLDDAKSVEIIKAYASTNDDKQE